MANRQPVLTEPTPLPCILVTGFELQATEEHIIRLVIWCDIPVVGYDQPECRIQARLPNGVFRRLLAEGRRTLGKHSH